MVRVLAFPDLEHVLPRWDVTSLNTHFLSPCFWFPLWIDWPANNAAQRYAPAGPNHCKLSHCQSTAPRRACTPQIKKQGFQLETLISQTWQEGTGTHNCRLAQIFYMNIYPQRWQNTPVQPFQRTPLHLCQLMPTSLGLSCHSQVLENSTSICVWESDNIFMRKKWGGHTHSMAAELNREHSQLSVWVFPKGCSTEKVETCPYTWHMVTVWAVVAAAK